VSRPEDFLEERLRVLFPLEANDVFVKQLKLLVRLLQEYLKIFRRNIGAKVHVSALNQ
jgi:hypothetical protein